MPKREDPTPISIQTLEIHRRKNAGRGKELCGLAILNGSRLMFKGCPRTRQIVGKLIEDNYKGRKGRDGRKITRKQPERYWAELPHLYSLEKDGFVLTKPKKRRVK